MKLSITTLAVAVVMFASCNKDYTCTCTVTSKGTTHAIPKDLGTLSKSDAEDKCDAMRTEYTDPASGVNAVCHL